MTTFHTRRALWLGALALMPLAVTGCGHNQTDNTAGNPIVPMNANDTVASVAGQTISQSLFFTQLQNFAANPQGAQPVPAGRAVLTGMITGLVFEQMAQDKKAAPTDAEVNTQYDNLKLSQDAQNIKPLEARLADLGMTASDLKETQIRPQLAQLKLLTVGQAAPTAAEIKKYYDDDKDKQFTKPARAHLKTILLASKSDAQSIYQQIQSGTSFATFQSKSLNKQTPDGDLPQWVPTEPNPANPQAAQTKPLTDAAAKTDVGKTAAPFQLGNAFWLVQVVERKPKETVSFDQAKSLIPFELLVQKAGQNQAGIQALQQQERDYQQKLANDGKITVSLSGLQYVGLLNDLKNPPPPAPAQPQFAPPGGPPMPRR